MNLAIQKFLLCFLGAAFVVSRQKQKWCKEKKKKVRQIVKYLENLLLIENRTGAHAGGKIGLKVFDF